MWNAPKETIPEWQIENAHLDVLDRAVAEAAEFDVRRDEVFKALQYLQEKCLRYGGIRLFREGLAIGDLKKLKEGLKQIKENLSP